jgi:ABC-type hemin transport system ATPase subunit
MEPRRGSWPSLIRRFAEDGEVVAVITHDLDFVAEFVPRGCCHV